MKGGWLTKSAARYKPWARRESVQKLEVRGELDDVCQGLVWRKCLAMAAMLNLY